MKTWWWFLSIVLVILSGCSNDDQPTVIVVNSPSGVVTLPPRAETGNIGITVDFESRSVTVTNYNDRVVGVQIANNSSLPFQDNWISGGGNGSSENVNVVPGVEYRLRVLYYTFNVISIIVRAIQDWGSMDSAWIDQEFNSKVIFNPNTQSEYGSPTPLSSFNSIVY